MNKLINWHELSRILSGNGQNIRPNKIPDKYKRQVTELLTLLNDWSVKQHNNKY